MNITAIQSLATTAERAALTSTDDAFELSQQMAYLQKVVAREPHGEHRHLARKVVALAEQVLAGQAEIVAAEAERAAPGATGRLQTQYDGLIVAAKAGL